MISKIKTVLAAGLTVALASAAAVPAFAQSNRQKDKNNARNLAAVLGGVAAHQAIKGKGTNAIVLGAGAAYAAKKSEDARKAQNKENARRTTRVYKYSNGKRVGYYNVVNGKRGSLHRL